MMASRHGAGAGQWMQRPFISNHSTLMSSVHKVFWLCPRVKKKGRQRAVALLEVTPGSFVASLTIMCLAFWVEGNSCFKSTPFIRNLTVFISLEMLVQPFPTLFQQQHLVFGDSQKAPLSVPSYKCSTNVCWRSVCDKSLAFFVNKMSYYTGWKHTKTVGLWFGFEIN